MNRELRAANDNNKWTFGLVALMIIVAHLLIYLTVVAFFGVSGG